MEADIIVVGFGAAHMAAAETAHKQGAMIVVSKKAPEGKEGRNTWVA